MDTRTIQPNVTHKVLAQLEEMGKLTAVVTQNIDGLHQLAGSKNVFEIHGTTKENYCTICGKRYDADYIFESTEKIPRCDCTPTRKGMIRPNVTMYGEDLPNEAVVGALKAIREADMLIIAGTSLSVYPAANYIYDFTGDYMVVINRDKLNIMLGPNDIEINDSLGSVFGELEKMLKEDEK